MKIAAITDDGQTISQHFGRANYYLVVTVENGQLVTREMRDKLSHTHFANEPHTSSPSHAHGFGAEEQGRHARMAQAITDCQVLLCRGMGMGAYESMKEYGIKPIVTSIVTIDEAIKAYLDGSIVDHVDRLH
ncbi:MAG: dinitrogenase iron-molybdenum cofactor biosynthesis protein [Anaerolineales bacterium]|nr:dinitrogenase iron-molybdenum cofactor biosynthesis protein [Anaerolineae bacterium]PWB49560.1 MAG: dinitrogenase iron-molybdenum cofactor biosynthesis protein [Anaerolineales bacterium]